MNEPAGYAEWLKRTTTRYRGYVIGRGSVSLDGDCLFLFHSRLDAPLEDCWDQGRRIVDKHIADQESKNG